MARLKTHRDFEAVQTLLAVFLRLHGEFILTFKDDERGNELQETLEALFGVQKSESERILELVSSGLGTLSFVRDAM
jgi:U3 small nucleolar RNA-associated protein 21